MKKKFGNIIFISLLTFSMLPACKKPFFLPVAATQNSYLVVEGTINTGADSTFVSISRTVQLSSKNTSLPERNALVTVEGENNASFTLTEISDGHYAAGPFSLDPTKKCRLHIKSNDGRDYLSDFVEIKNTPEIDSIPYHIQGDGLQFFVNAHDKANTTRYYRWEFEETYKYVSFVRSTAILDNNGFPRYRTLLDPNIYECYNTLASHQVLLGSSAKLGEDIISQQPINFVSAQSGKISLGYSFLLRQYALTQAAFDYWQILKKNTEQLGSIFDAQPSSLTGNIHCKTNPAEPVIGYVSASSIKMKRIFIDHFDISLFTPSYVPPPPSDDCGHFGAIPIEPMDTYAARLYHALGSGDSVLSSPIAPPGGPITGYSYGPKECVDCRAKIPTGTNVKPSFWK